MNMLPDPCAECGRVHSTVEPNAGVSVSACSGHRSRVRDDEGGLLPCRNQPVRGLTVCRFHGAASERARRRAERALAQQAEEERLTKARKIAARFALTVTDTNPLDAIQAELDRGAGLIQYYLAKLVEVDDKALTFGVAKIEDIRAGQGRPGRNTTFEAQPSMWLRLLNEERDRHAKLAVEAVKIGLEARRVQIRQEESRALIAVLDGSLRALGLDPGDAKVAAVVARQLEALPGGAA
jgi:hypothetical protein